MYMLDFDVAYLVIDLSTLTNLGNIYNISYYVRVSLIYN